MSIEAFPSGSAKQFHTLTEAYDSMMKALKERNE